MWLPKREQIALAPAYFRRRIRLEVSQLRLTHGLCNRKSSLRHGCTRGLRQKAATRVPVRLYIVINAAE